MKLKTTQTMIALVVKTSDYTYYKTFQMRQRNMQRLSTITIPITKQKLDLQENRYRYTNRVDATVIKLTHI